MGLVVDAEVPQVLDGRDGPGHQTGAGRDTLRSWAILAVPALVILIASWIYRWVQDDAFINFRIIGNLLAGHGPVFNIGERVEAYSDPLWLFLLALVHEIVPSVTLEWTSALLGIAFAVAGVLLGGRAVQRLAASRAAAPWSRSGCTCCRSSPASGSS